MTSYLNRTNAFLCMLALLLFATSCRKANNTVFSVGIAEWPSTSGGGNVIIIAFGAYDWYSKPMSGASTTNAYLGNIQQLTKNSIDYLKGE